MARIREIRPGFFTDEDIGRCTPQARLLLAGLFTLADRAGRLEDRPLLIRTALFPYDPATDVETLLAELAQPKLYGQTSKSLVTRYVGTDGRRYLQVNNFARYQRFHPKEMETRIPGPTGTDVEPRPDSDQPRSAAEGLGLAGGEPRSAAEEPGEPVVSRSGPSGSSGPSGPSGPSGSPAAAAADPSPGSELPEGGCRGGTADTVPEAAPDPPDPPARTEGLRHLASAVVQGLRLEVWSAAVRLGKLTRCGPEQECLRHSATDSGAAFADPGNTGSESWLRVTLDRLRRAEGEARERFQGLGADLAQEPQIVYTPEQKAEWKAQLRERFPGLSEEAIS